MDEKNLYDWLDRNKTYLGSFALDENPKLTKSPPFSFIMNTDIRNGPGKHWIAYYYISPYTLYRSEERRVG